MSDPMNRPNQTPPPPPPSDEPPRRSTGPLIWILLLIALIAAGWYFYSQRGATEAPAEPETPIGEPADIGDGTPPPPASEREDASTTPAREPAAAAAPATRPADPLERIEPTYPPTALRAQEEGTVLLRVQVDAQGNPTEVDVARSSRSRELDRAARDAVRKWKFSPAMENGQAVASTVEVPIDFRMDAQ